MTCVDTRAVHAEDQLLLDVGRPARAALERRHRARRQAAERLGQTAHERSVDATTQTWQRCDQRGRRPGQRGRHDRARGGDRHGAAGDRRLERAEPLAVAGTPRRSGTARCRPRSAPRARARRCGPRSSASATRRASPSAATTAAATASGAHRSQVPCTASSSCWNRCVELVAGAQLGVHGRQRRDVGQLRARVGPQRAARGTPRAPSALPPGQQQVAAARPPAEEARRAVQHAGARDQAQRAEPEPARSGGTRAARPRVRPGAVGSALEPKPGMRRSARSRRRSSSRSWSGISTGQMSSHAAHRLDACATSMPSAVRLEERRQHGADRAAVDPAVGVAADLAVHGADVLAGAAADAVQDLLVAGAEDRRAAAVDDHDVHLLGPVDLARRGAGRSSG